MDQEKLIKWLNNELSEAEKAELKETDDFRKYESIISELSLWHLPELSTEAKLQEFYKKRSETVVIKWYQQPVIRIAAAILVILTIGIYFYSSTAQVIIYKTGIGESKEFILPDNSIVILGPESSISYKRRDWGNKRRVKQKGKAYYEVQSNGSSFEVSFDNTTLEVLGTSFEIINLVAFQQVTCFTGIVRLTTSEESIELSAGMGATVENGSFNSYEDRRQWNQDITRFTSAPLSTVFKSIEQQFDVKINSDKIDLKRTFTGAYPNKSVKNALKAVCSPMNISYDIDGDNITLR